MKAVSNPINGATLRQQLAFMRDKVTAFNSLVPAGNFRRNGVNIGDIFKKALDRSAEEQAAEDEKMHKLIRCARDGDKQARTELNSFRTTTIDLYVRAMSNFASFFRTVDLKPEEMPVFINTYRNAVNVKYLGQDGNARTAKAVKAQSQTFVDMRELHTDEVGYQVRDIQLGTNVADAAKATVDLGWDMSNQIDLSCYSLLTTGTSQSSNGIFGPFSTTGASLKRTYIANPRINAANLPTTNDLVLSDNSGSTLFRLAVCRAILKYCNSWGNIFGEPIRPTGLIYVPSSESTDLSSEITPTSLIFPNAVAEGLLQSYSQFDYMGVRWTLVPDVTLPLGTAYVPLNRPVGELFFKPAFDEEFVETDRKKNWETRSEMKVLALTIPEPWRPFALRVTYHS